MIGAERFTRSVDGWTRATFAIGEELELGSTGLTLSMDDLHVGASPSGG